MNHILQIGKNLGMKHNVSFRVIDKDTRQVVSTHVGHNAATNSMLLGIAYYLTGNGVFNQASSMLTEYIPKYISLGTMGLFSQDQDQWGLPAGVGVSAQDSEEQRFKDYMSQVPGYGADGYDMNCNNGRLEFGLGPMFQDRLGGVATPGTVTISDPCNCECDDCGASLSGNYVSDEEMLQIKKSGTITKTYSVIDTRPTIGCELIDLSHQRVAISFRDVVPEYESEISETIDVVFSAMISTGALKAFRETGRDYIFITEAGLWSKREWSDSGENGLLAAYRIAPPDSDNWDMEVPSNREILKQNILRVGKNQVVQVIWKVQIGAVEQLNSTVINGDSAEKLRWLIWNPNT